MIPSQRPLPGVARLVVRVEVLGVDHGRFRAYVPGAAIYAPPGDTRSEALANLRQVVVAMTGGDWVVDVEEIEEVE